MLYNVHCLDIFNVFMATSQGQCLMATLTDGVDFQHAAHAFVVCITIKTHTHTSCDIPLQKAMVLYTHGEFAVVTSECHQCCCQTTDGE